MLLWCGRQATALVGTWLLPSLSSCEMSVFILSRSSSCCCIPCCRASTSSCRRCCRTESVRVWRRAPCATTWRCIWKATPITSVRTATTVTSTPTCCAVMLSDSWKSVYCRPSFGRTTSDRCHSRSIVTCGTGWRTSCSTHTSRHSLPKHSLVCRRLSCCRLNKIRSETKRCCTGCGWWRRASSWRTVTSRAITAISIIDLTISFYTLGNIYEFL